MNLVSRKSPLDAIAKLVAAVGSDPLCIYEDLSLAGARERVIEQVRKRHERIDVLVNNAGITVRKPAEEEVRPERWAEVIEVNLNAVFHLCQLTGRTIWRRVQGRLLTSLR